MQLDQLEPKAVWEEFFQICKIPHGSGNVDAIRAFLRKRCEDRGFKCYEDGFAGNLLIVKPADAGFEKAPVICLQGHMDMVCSKRSDCAHDFLKDPIVPRIQTVDGKQCVVATGTTLGADDGMGIAAGLAIIFDKTLKTGKIEVLCTKDEETTMHGVLNMKNDFLTSDYLLNLDSEDIGVITIGSAGGFCGDVIFPKMETKKCPADACQCLKMKFSNLSGGHSGVDIHHYKGNAIKCLARVMTLALKYGGRLCSVKGGSAHNAIPMDAECCMCFEGVQAEKISELIENAKKMGEEIVKEFKTTDPNIKFEINKACECSKACECISVHDSERLIDLINILPSHVLRMSADVKGLTESSINVGTLNFTATEGGKLTVLARSSLNSFLQAIDQQMAAMCRLAKFEYVGFRDAYGGWAPNVNSKLLKATIKHYALTMKVPEDQIKVEAIHAGLECGELISKYPKLEAVSIGPTVKNPHSDRELCEIDTVVPFYETVKNVILELAK
ncbi:Aminoacyl-histidine_dipeptidase [Hexamita inflata]|uniref:Aminoacyl-histidine_dipeptidase n=1 Tax=Hexamita inflata TaxID=28002 RepID=A0ABP1GIK1_9EUKA